MQTADLHISRFLSQEFKADAMSVQQLRTVVEQYPYFHAARMLLLRQLFQLHDVTFSDELRRASIYLPSREAIFQLVEESQFRPKPQAEPALQGAVVAHKAVERVASPSDEQPAQRTETLIDSFLSTLPADDTPHTPAERRRSRPIDASQDYIGYMLQEEEENRQRAAREAAKKSKEAAGKSAQNSESASPRTVEKKEQPVQANKQAAKENEQALQENKLSAKENNPIGAERKDSSSETTNSDTLIDRFIQDKGDRRIRLNNKKDSELQKPVLTTENSGQQGTFTEALARIYIKQGKFEHAIEIIRRLSLKYPKKNRYFADQLRFLDKLLENQRFAKASKEDKE